MKKIRLIQLGLFFIIVLQCSVITYALDTIDFTFASKNEILVLNDDVMLKVTWREVAGADNYYVKIRNLETNAITESYSSNEKERFDILDLGGDGKYRIYIAANRNGNIWI